MKDRAYRITLLIGTTLLLAGLAGCVGEPLEPNESPESNADNATNGTPQRDPRPAQDDEPTQNTTGDRGGNETANAGQPNGTDERASNDTSKAGTHDPGWPPVSEASIRPGAKLGLESNVLGETNYCTVGFVFSDPSNRTLYVATAAHCLGEVEIGTEITLAGIEGAGRLVYCSWGTAERGGRAPCPPHEDLSMNRTRDNDLALVRVLDEFRSNVHPAMVGFQGPAAINRNASLGDKVLTYGNSPWRDAGPNDSPDVLDPREGYVEGQSEWTTRFHLVGHTIGGDSGSPVRTPDGALGLLIRTGSHENPPAVVATNLGPAIDFVNEETDLTVELKTWPEQSDGRLPTVPDRTRLHPPDPTRPT